MIVLDTNVLSALMRSEPDDRGAAEAAAELAARRQRAGRTVDIRDTFIAGIVTSRKGTLATRNIRHFDDLDVPVVNPWQ